MNWAFIQKHLDWAGHIVEAICIAAVVFVILWAGVTTGAHLLALAGLTYAVPFTWQTYALLAAAFATGHFHGREKRDCEVRLKMKPPHLWGYDFRLWSFDEHTDFWPVVATFSAFLFLVIALFL